MYEKEIELKTCSYARTFSMLAYKFTSPHQRAVPDRLFVYQGMAFFIEFKREGQKPTPSQIREHAKLRQHGISVFVIDSLKRGKGLIDLITEGVPLTKINNYGAYDENEAVANPTTLHLPKKGG